MLLVGLTGGIGSGKSVVAGLFESMGAGIIDTDLIARDLVAPGSPALYEISDHLGQSILTPDGNLNRRLMREMIFSNPTEKKWLENLLHPMIRETVRQKIQTLQSPYGIIVIPLLTEIKKEGYDYLDRICVVDCDEVVQIQRTMERDDISESDAMSMLEAQATREERLKIADDVIENNGDLNDLRKKVDILHKQYLEMSS